MNGKHRGSGMIGAIYEKLAQHQDEILALARRYGARNVRVFGSVARRDVGEESDLDLLVDLQDLLACSVDIVTEGGLRGAFRDRVLAEAVPIEEMAA